MNADEKLISRFSILMILTVVIVFSAVIGTGFLIDTSEKGISVPGKIYEIRDTSDEYVYSDANQSSEIETSMDYGFFL